MGLNAPSYGDPRVSDSPLQTPKRSGQAPVEAFGGGMSQVTNAARGLTGDVQKLIAQEQERADFDQMAQKRIALNDWERESVYDTKTGALGKLGQDALGVSERTRADYDKFTDDQDRQLATDGQRQAYRAMVIARKEHITKVLDSHEGDQIQALHIGTLKASTASSIERAATDPSTAGLESHMVDDNARKLSKSLGFSPDMEAVTRARAKSDLHTQVIQRMLSAGNDLAAKDYFSEWGNNIIGDDAERVQARLQQGSVKGAAYRELDRIVTPVEQARDFSEIKPGEEAPPRTVKRTLDEALAEVDQIKDDDVREKTQGLVLHHYAIQDKIERQREEDAYKAAYNAVSKSGDADKLPTGVLESFAPNLQHSLRERAYQVATGRQAPPNGQRYYDLRQMAASEGSRQEFIDMNLVSEGHKMTNQELGHLMELQASLRQKDGKFDDELHSTMSAMSMIDSVVSGKLKGDEEALFKRIASYEVDRVRKQKKDKFLEPAEVQKIADGLMKEVVVSPWKWWAPWTSTVPMYKVMEKNRVNALEVPGPDRARIEGQFKARKAVPTDAEVLEVYRAELQKKVDSVPPR